MRYILCNGQYDRTYCVENSPHASAFAVSRVAREGSLLLYVSDCLASEVNFCESTEVILQI